MNHALAAVANEGKLNADAVLVPLELLYIAEHECFMQFVYGSMTPAILCANLYTLEIGMMRQLWPMAFGHADHCHGWGGILYGAVGANRGLAAGSKV